MRTVAIGLVEAVSAEVVGIVVLIVPPMVVIMLEIISLWPKLIRSLRIFVSLNQIHTIFKQVNSSHQFVSLAIHPMFLYSKGIEGLG